MESISLQIKNHENSLKVWINIPWVMTGNWNLKNLAFQSHFSIWTRLKFANDVMESISLQITYHGNSLKDWIDIPWVTTQNEKAQKQSDVTYLIVLERCAFQEVNDVGVTRL